MAIGIPKGNEYYELDYTGTCVHMYIHVHVTLLTCTLYNTWQYMHCKFYHTYYTHVHVHVRVCRIIHEHCTLP